MNERQNRKRYVQKRDEPKLWKITKKVVIIALCIVVTPIIILSMLDPQNWPYMILIFLFGPLLNRKY
ncbi:MULTISPECIES: hypothetical protein [Bacillota]|uniref:hypothetical protein n=1 Tax=Bacillota TaxID=1239 RepID=UPI0021BAE0CC|nr:MULTISPECIES: hypothetical protein [Bacillota]UXE89310.1 hypothetical protein N4560_11700 [Limosilactobacillus reuteri]